MRILSVVLAILAPQAAKADDYDPSFTLQLENDWFGRIGGANVDRDYTTGIRLAWQSGAIHVPSWVQKLAAPPRIFGSKETNTVWRWGLSVNQTIYTPNDTQTTALITDDRPYAAWLSAGVSLQGIHRQGLEPVRMDTFDVSFGVVGPWALGEELQNNFHNLIDDETTKGWGNQLSNEPALQITYERRWRTGSWEFLPGAGLEVDAVPYVGAGLGNVAIYGAAGGIVRVGQDLQKDFGPPSVRPSLPGSESFGDRGFSWYLFGGLEGDVVGRNIFLDGNTFQNSASVDKRTLVGSAKVGAVIFLGDLRLAYTHTLRTPEFHERNRYQSFGAVTVGLSF